MLMCASLCAPVGPRVGRQEEYLQQVSAEECGHGFDLAKRASPRGVHDAYLVPRCLLRDPDSAPLQFVFGLQDGKVRLVQLKSSKTVSLYSANSFVVSSCSKCVVAIDWFFLLVILSVSFACDHRSADGSAILTGHADGSIYRFTFEVGSRPPSSMKLTTHSVRCRDPMCSSCPTGTLPAECALLPLLGSAHHGCRKRSSW